MTIPDFIEKAIAGGWKWHGSKVSLIRRTMRFQHDGYTEAINEAAIFLDPKAWKAVGKVEKWKSAPYNPAEIRMSKMIDALWDGKTIEEYLKTL